MSQEIDSYREALEEEINKWAGYERPPPKMLKELRENQPENSTSSRLGKNSPGEIRTLVGGSKARYA